MTVELPTRGPMYSPAFVPGTSRFGTAAGGAPGITPTTWNPSDKGAAITLSEENLKATISGSSHTGVRSIASATSGKFYWEITFYTLATNVCFGVSTAGADLGYLGAGRWHLAYPAGQKSCNAGGSAWVTISGTSGTCGVALDMDNGKIWITDISGSWLSSGDPAAGSNAMCDNLSEQTVYASVGLYWSGAYVTANFGASEFTYEVPSGFSSGFGA